MEKKTEKKLKVKCTRHRRRDLKVTTQPDACKFINRATGFAERDILIVLQSYSRFIGQSLEDKRCVNIPKVGILYPLLHPERKAMSMNGGKGVPTIMTMSARWNPRFRPARTIVESLKAIVPTEKEIANLYE